MTRMSVGFGVGLMAAALGGCTSGPGPSASAPSHVVSAPVTPAPAPPVAAPGSRAVAASVGSTVPAAARTTRGVSEAGGAPGPSRTAATAGPISGRGSVQGAIEVPAPMPAEPSPVLSIRVGDEEGVSREIEKRLARAVKTIGTLDLDRLGDEQRVIKASAQDFIDKAREALASRDLLRARALADKAAALASELAGARRTVR